MSLFFGAEIKEKADANAYLLGLCWDEGSSFRRGAAKAPKIIREYTSSKLYNPYTERGINLKRKWRIYDLGDIHPKSISNTASMAKEKLSGVKIANFYLFLGGDHSITYATMKVLKETLSGKWGLIYLDAHPDLYGEYEGNAYSHACTARRIVEEKLVNPENIVQIGIRASTAEQWKYAEEKGIRILTTSDIRRMNPSEVLSNVESHLGSADYVYLSFDVDVLDPAFAPGVGNPEGGGLTTRELVDVIQAFENLPIRAVDVVEANPDFDYAGITFCSVSKFIREVLGVIPSSWIHDKFK